MRGLEEVSSISAVKMFLKGNLLAIQWLGVGTITDVAQVQSLVKELGSHSHIVGWKKKVTSDGRKPPVLSNNFRE